ncbi:unnamed protein product [Brassica oleracea]|uniref:(rape) hypothetical protein n=1 Tax=Brassica napus TaxID=3708 RepID=A0A816RNM4_BRANA|nr:unnamed protein product [Brassica napus]
MRDSSFCCGFLEFLISVQKERVMSHGEADRCTYGERILGSSSEYLQSNITRYFSDPRYYFQVNDQYVRNKLKVVLFSFPHRVSLSSLTFIIPRKKENNLI